ncbi:TPA: phage tail tape measure protein [Proteus mirabilis]|uniref:phage tail tape measure protein n=1 Tax=Proteus mirabilis TaxID=584 RepID=UPI001A2010FF|nr:phage tail tape measure protein [Proteus mirabilis]HDU8621966.1 phage tail tape measure protein [Proteus mirabilis]HEI9882976.1 phage tail tape measure protein [Proteus mirabilis]HEK0603175.1 phage tail tape measure protein [Proteus mirabilis]
MATNLADLRVGLLLNDASFRSNITDAMNHAGRETERFSRKAKQNAKDVSDSFHSIGTSVKQVAGSLAMVGGVSLSIGSILGISRQYGQALSDLAAITGAAGEQLKVFDEAAQEMGRTTQYSAMQAAEAIKLMAASKPELMKTSEGLINVTKSSLILAQASGTTLPDATRTLALSLNQFGASVSDADRYINVLAAGSRYGASEVNETAEAIKKGGVAAAQAKVPFEEMNAVIQTLAEREVKGADAGTALRNMILILESSTDKKLKPSVVGMTTALENLAQKNYSTTALTKIFGRENVNAAMILSKNTDKVRELTKALTGTETAYEQAKERTNNLNGDLQNLASAFEGLAIKAGQSANGPLRTGIQSASDAINTLSNNLSTLVNVGTYAVLPVIGARMTRGLQEQTKEWVKNEAVVRNNAKQMRENAQETIDLAKASREQAQQESRRLGTQSVLMRQYGINANYQKEYLALNRKIREAERQEAIGKQRLIAANNQLSYSQRALRASSLGLRSVVSALGGPVGVLALAGSAIYYFATRADEAKLKIEGMKGAVVETITELQRLSRVKIEVQLDEIKEELALLESEKKRLYGEQVTYSEKREGEMSSIKDSGWLGYAAVSLWGKDSEEFAKGRRKVLSEIEDIDKEIEIRKQKIANRESTLKAGVFSQPTEEDKPVNAGGGGGNDGGNDLVSGSKQKVNQYHQLRMQIEQEHATSLERISLSESETMRKLQESLKAGGMKQAEYERLKTLNAENHMKQRAELAEKYSPMRTSLRNEQEMTKELKSLFEQRLLTEKEYQYARMQMDKDMSKYRLSEQAKGISLPNISILGEIDPVIQLRNQLEEQKALYQAYYEDGLVSKERYEQLIIAATNKSKEAQYQSSKEFYASQGMWQRMQMNLVDAVEQRTANAMTGMLMGTKSFSEGMKEFSSSLASSIISDLIRIAIQAQITNALTGLMGGFAGSGGATSGAKAGKVGVKANAKGDVYSSPSLSQYSNQVVSSPTLFAFAKGGTPNLGLMGEAGSEAIMPLKRGPDGSLGVRATGNSVASGDTIIHQTFHVTGNGDEALYQAIQEAARIGAEQGASKAKSDIMRDFQTNGTLRRNLR